MYQFGHFLLKTQPPMLLHKGARVDCDPRALQLLLLLVKNRSRVLDRATLIEALWPNRVVSDASLSQLVHKARQLLSDNGKAPSYIQTVHGQGFRWIAPTQEIPQATIAEARPLAPVKTRMSAYSRMLLLTLVLFVVAGALLWTLLPSHQKPPASHERVALLPFEYNNAEVQYSWIPLGLMEMVAQMLQGTPGLELISPRKVLAWMEEHPQDAHSTDALLQNMCPQLGCTRLLVTKIQGQPIPEKLSFHWVAKGYQSPETRLQGKDMIQLAHRMAFQIRKPYQQTRATHLEDVSFSGNAQANQAYALAQQARLEGKLDLARQYLQIALGQAENFAMARAYLAEAEEQLSELTLAEQHAQQVLQQQGAPWQARFVALKTLSNIQYSRGDLTGSQDTTRQILLQDWPLSDSDRAKLSMNTGTTLQRLGRIDEARQWLQESDTLFSRSHDLLGQAMNQVNLGNLELSENRFRQAMRWYEKAEKQLQRLGHQQYALIARFQLAVVYKNLEFYPQAAGLFQQLEQDSRNLKDMEGALLARMEYLDTLNRQHPDPQRQIQALPALIREAEALQLAYPAHLGRNALAVAYWQRQQPVQGLDWLQPASALGKSDYNTQMIHALLLWQKEDLPSALDTAQSARKLAGKGWPEAYQAWLQAMQDAEQSGGQFKEAFASLGPPAL